jgi:ABC-type Fe3+-siderophore transport system permease subunit
VAWLLILVATVAVIAVLSVTFGNRTVSLPDIVAGLTGDIETTSAAAVARRVPRTLLALLVGAALAMAGTVMQGVTRNPLADPQILGINGGASRMTKFIKGSVNLDFPEIAGGSSAEVNFTVTGATTGDVLQLSGTMASSALKVAESRISAAGVGTARCYNSGSTTNPPSRTFTYLCQ